MALIKCQECGREISHTAMVCPYCGRDYPQLEEIAYNKVKKREKIKEYKEEHWFISLIFIICIPLSIFSLIVIIAFILGL